MDLITVQSFIAVAESGSFTKAAERIGRTQSAVSQQVAKFEGILGKPLLNRGKAITLTPEGEAILGYARKIDTLHREMMERFRQPELEGEVRFGVPENFASVFLSDVLADFSRIHPRILLKIECDLTLNLFERFRQKEFDLVLVKMNQPEDFPNGTEVWSEPLRWVGDPSLIDPARPVPLVLAPKPCVYRASAIKALDAANRSWRLVLSSPSYAGAVAAVKAGMGITVMPQTMIPGELRAIGVNILPRLDETHVSLLKHRNDVPAIETLEGFVLSRFKR